ncbi:MAG: hypothetical protein A3H27_19160 [Acidobacteria bacterium RIFCSPLOWO2_02_FULL_59_13]|nr:MAG: hypothetical protein A3H27_19160 [Acidobacteria bacterium RIFCSPLOWO2_02_FULL_59_13]
MRQCKALLAVTMLMAWLAPRSPAQGESGTAGQESEIAPQRTTRITLGSTAATPGTAVVVPIYFTPAEGVQVESLELVVDFISANLKFNRLDPGMAAEIGKVQVNAEVKQGKNERGVETSTLTITAAMPASPPPEKGIPPGLLGYLTMRLDGDARSASITLRTTAKASELKTNNPIQNLQVFESRVDVLEAGSQPMLACFFFTH